MDSLEYFSRFLGLPEMIFHHLSGKELLSLSEVNSTYYDCIASSDRLMSKIKVVHKCDSILTDQDSEMLRSSSRIYRNLEIRCQHEDATEWRNHGEYFSCISSDHHHLIRTSIWEFVSTSSRGWKDIRVSNTYFSSQDQVFAFLSAVESTVDKICLDNVQVCELADVFEESRFTDKTYKVLKFPKLRKLTLLLGSHVVTRILLVIFSNCENIQKLDFRDCLEWDYCRADLAFGMLKNFDKLKSLKLYTSNLKEFSESDKWEEFRFKLKSFKIVWCNIDQIMWLQDNEQRAVLNLLESSAESLERLSWAKMMDVKNFKIIEKLPKLRNFNLQMEPWTEPDWDLTEWSARVSGIETSSTVELKFLEEFPFIQFTKREKSEFPQHQRFITFAVNKEKLSEIALE